MKKRIAVLLSLAFLLAAGVPHAMADLIWLPTNVFFIAHENECKEVHRIYEAAEDTCSRTEPDGSEKNPVPAGTVMRVTHTWQEKWGTVEGTEEWIDLGFFRRLYDALDFREEHGEELVPADAMLLFAQGTPRIVWNDKRALEEAGVLPEEGAYDLVLWEYPGSDRIDSIRGYMGEEDPQYGPQVSEAWTDRDGHVWLHIDAYYYGRMNGWLYLPDMNGTQPPFVSERYADGTAEKAPDGEKEGGAAGAVASGGQDSGGSAPPLLPIASVVLVTAVTGAMLLKLRPKKKAPEA